MRGIPAINIPLTPSRQDILSINPNPLRIANSINQKLENPNPREHRASPLCPLCFWGDVPGYKNRLPEGQLPIVTKLPANPARRG